MTALDQASSWSTCPVPFPVSEPQSIPRESWPHLSQAISGKGHPMPSDTGRTPEGPQGRGLTSKSKNRESAWRVVRSHLLEESETLQSLLKTKMKAHQGTGGAAGAL